MYNYRVVVVLRFVCLGFFFFRFRENSQRPAALIVNYLFCNRFINPHARTQERSTYARTHGKLARTSHNLVSVWRVREGRSYVSECVGGSVEETREEAMV